MAAEPTTFGAALRRLRLAAGLTQEALAECSQLSERAIRDLERDRGRIPRLQTVRLLAEALGLDDAERSRLLTLVHPVPGRAEALDAAPPTAVHKPNISGRFLTPLIGRAEDVWAVKAILDDVRLVTVSGPGGVGKTRLAAEVAVRVAHTFERILFLELAPLQQPAQIIAAIAASLSIREEGAVSLLDVIVGNLHAGRVLLVLDNMEHLLDARDLVLDLLAACPDLRILITSREALRVRGERVYTLGPLSLPERVADIARSPAVRLFLDRSRDAGTEIDLRGETAHAVVELCRRLDGLPLAIELAAAWSSLLAPVELLGRLSDRLPYLDRGAHDLPDRQRTMRDTIAWSYTLLRSEEQALFRALSLFSGGFTVDAALAVAGEPGKELGVLAGLAALQTKNLLMTRDMRQGTAEPRLSMLETIREYGLAMLEETDEADQIRSRYLAYYRGYVWTAAGSMIGSDHALWQGRLEREHDNLRAALQWALDTADLDAAQDLAEGLWRFWSLGGHVSEGRAWLRQVRERLPEGRAAGILAAAAVLALEQGDFEEAARLGERAATLARRHGEDRALVLALDALGDVAWRLDRYGEARDRYEEALRVSREIGYREGELEALSSLALEAGFSGDLTRAAAVGEEAIAVARELRDPHALATASIGQAFRTATAGHYDQSAAFAQQALDLFRSLGDPGKVAEALFALSTAVCFQRQYGRAVALLEECLALRVTRGDWNTLAATQGALGIALLNAGDPARAETMLEASYRSAREHAFPLGQAIGLASLAHLALARQDPVCARSMGAESARLFLEIGGPVYLPWSLEALAGAAAQEDRWDLAALLSGARDALLESIGSSASPLFPVAFDTQLGAARAALGAATFEALRTEGRAMPLETVLAEAATPDEHSEQIAGERPPAVLGNEAQEEQTGH